MTFRFEELEVWELSVEIGEELFEIADELENKNLYRFAEQLRGAGLSISNNIAEGAGANSDEEFCRYLSIARNSVFENANMLLIFHRQNLIDAPVKDELIRRLETLAKKISAFKASLQS